MTTPTQHYAVVGLGFGDEGKGTITDYLCETHPEIDTVVRYSGGAQAGHRVVKDNGQVHVFRSFGAGTLTRSRRIETFFGPKFLVDPLRIADEASTLESMGVSNPLGRLVIDPSCLITTPIHVELNRYAEASRGNARHGSCGLGIGATRQFELEHPGSGLRIADLAFPEVVKDKLEFMVDTLGGGFEDVFYESQLEEMAEAYDRFVYSGVRVRDVKRALEGRSAVFEGSQGVLLDETYGFAPFYTWTDVTFRPVDELVPRDSVTRIGVTRAYGTRHGAGPFPGEVPGLAEKLPDPANHLNRWQGDWRAGMLDLPALHYALRVCGGVDQLAVTHLDKADDGDVFKQLVYSYADEDGCFHRRYPRGLAEYGLTEWIIKSTPQVLHYDQLSYDGPLSMLRSELGVPVTITSYGPRASDKKELISRGA